MTHSPFHVVEGFAPVTLCERLHSELGRRVPDREGEHPLPYERLVPPELAGPLHAELEAIRPELEARYGGRFAGVSTPVFQQYFEDQKAAAKPHGCENSTYARRKWSRVRDIDLTAVLWLKDHCASVPMDPRSDVYGGKLEFPAYDFSLLPQRGTLVVYPAGPHFISAISHVLLGSLEQVRIGIRLRVEGDQPWTYEPSRFPGSYSEWFAELP